MAITVKLPTQLRDAAAGAQVVAVDGATVRDALESLFAAHAELRERLCDESGAVRRFVNVYVDGEDIRFGEDLATPLSDGAQIQVLPAVAGG
ncbi:MAG: MoaD/ThiS family protein [Solirubrobacteraceae bacterium]|nr:MoaD/ThiS family protein [Solirubrobacteraceae bacterium]